MEKVVLDPRACGIWGEDFLKEHVDFEVEIPFQEEIMAEHRAQRLREKNAIKSRKKARKECNRKAKEMMVAVAMLLSFGFLVAAEALCNSPWF